MVGFKSKKKIHIIQQEQEVISMNSEKHSNYPSKLSSFMKQSGLISQEEQQEMERYLWNTAFEEIF
jgi:hypothetical protein